MQTTYVVKGMTCGHCASSVTEEVSALPGVEKVDVALETGKVTVTSADELATEKVGEAVDEAGYELVGVAELGRVRSNDPREPRGASPECPDASRPSNFQAVRWRRG
ncbi:heavy-metal-associated domain-containing protein [Glycomyces buryatensis]|uniref:Heavy-metal-associated domain-containing protein n=1 Tax=Glycomyces buryatensis TaxID=2570927 RepID=A0A4S8Q9J9_9ACTN|nr:heavy-metal-associated domain-containing protein [Glycomyces buryatensis]